MLRTGILVFAAVLVAGCGGCGGGQLREGSFTRTHSGLLIDDPFDTARPTSALTKTYELDGSAPASHRRISADGAGLHVGVTRHAAGVFEGFFAVTKAAYPASSVFHVRMSRPPTAVPSPKESGEAVFAVQTGSTKQTGLINYVLVATSASAGLQHVLVGYAHGRIADARTKVLWEGPYAKSGPSTFDIVLRTDGRRSLEVWLNGRRVYASNKLSMAIASPFQPYLEVQGLGIAYVSTFRDFWVTASDTLTIENVKPGSPVTLSRPGGRVTARADSTGTARLTVGLPGARGRGTLTVAGRPPSTISYAGGDVLRA